jgi:hypothetical protein
VERVGERADDADLEAIYDRRFRSILRREKQPGETKSFGGNRDRKYSSNRVDAAVERQLAEDERVFERPGCQLSRGREDPERNWKVERGACLPDVCRREVDRDAVMRELETGIPDRELTRIFEKFYRVPDRADRVPGTGMGLHIAREIIRAHGGEIGVNSVVGEGSEFFFTLPAQEGNP